MNNNTRIDPYAERNRNRSDGAQEWARFKERSNAFLIDSSNTLLPFFRTNTGYRLLEPAWMTRVLLVMGGIGYWEFIQRYATTSMRKEALTLMAIASVLVVGAAVRRYRMRPWKQGAATHIPTYSRGNSVLMPFFRWLRIPEVFVQSYIEPLAALCLGGYFLLHVGWWLIGWWLIVSAITLAQTEAIVTQNERTMLMDLRDNRSNSQTLQANDQAEPAKQKKQSTAHENTATLSPEIMRLRKRR